MLTLALRHRRFHNDVNINGQLMATANGQVASFEHLAYFQYGPVGAAVGRIGTVKLTPGGVKLTRVNFTAGFDCVKLTA